MIEAAARRGALPFEAAAVDGQIESGPGRTWPPAANGRAAAASGAAAAAIAEATDRLGLADYEVRGWVGWHHHMTMTALAHHFLVRHRRRDGGA